MMAPVATLCLGKGAHCSCLIKFIHQSKDIAVALWCIDDLIVISRDMMAHGGKRFVSTFFQSSTIPGLLHAVEPWVRVEEQVMHDQLWGEQPTAKAPTTTITIDEQGDPNKKVLH